MTELFLALIVIIASKMRDSEQPPAFVYCLFSYLFFYLSPLANSVGQLALFGAVIEVVLVAFVVCIAGCLRAKVTYWVIGLSACSVFMHFYLWMLYINGANLANYDQLVYAYWAATIIIFASRIGPDGNSVWHTRFLRGDSGNYENVEILHK